MAESTVNVPPDAWDAFVAELLSNGFSTARVSDRTAVRLAVAGDPSLQPAHTCRKGMIGSAYSCNACWIADDPRTEGGAE